MGTIINECPVFVDNFNKNKCCARLSSNITKQCPYKSKQDGLCGIHYKLGKNKIKTVYDNIQAIYQKSTRVVHKSNQTILTFPLEYYKLNIKYIRTLQSYFRRYVVKQNIYYRSISCYCRHLVSNNTDCASFQDINIIPMKDYFAYKDSAKTFWAFHIATFKELLSHNFPNPYNTVKFSDMAIDRFSQLLSLCEKTGSIKIQMDVITDPHVKLQQKCIEVFQLMDGLKQYTQCNWFMDLNINQLKELYKQVEDIWNYRINLTPIDKCNYVKDGKLFGASLSHIQKLTSKIKLANIILDNFKRLVTEGTTIENRTTGALWILSGLTIVSDDARGALPWLFHSANVY
jgi:hypothetical protein